MQSVSAQWSVEEVDETRSISHSAQLAWKKDYISTIRFFTIGLSTIGGPDVIPGDGGVQSEWGRYRYTEESDYITRIGYERELNQPTGGLVKAIADFQLDNTSGRFTPDYSGGTSELATAVALPRRPVILNAGFNYNGIDNTIPQFVGITDSAPKISSRAKTVDLKATDFIGFLQDRYVDNEVMFTGMRSDQIIENILLNAGFSTSQYELDQGVNTISFGIFERGQKLADIINKVVQAENANFFQTEEGVLRFQARSAWYNAPYTEIQRIISTGQVIEAETPGTDHLINVVEIKASPRSKRENQLVFSGSGFAGSGAILVPAGGDKEQWVTYDDPMLEIDTPLRNGAISQQTSYFAANSEEDSSGSDLTSDIGIKSMSNFARASKIIFTNTGASDAYITKLDIWGRPARRSGDIYVRNELGASITAYEEKPLVIENEFIQDITWAESYSRMILDDFGHPENLQNITIRAIPELQLGDYVSWQGRYWRVFGIKTKIEPGSGFIQELKLLQRTLTNYFRIGVSLIGGSDPIAP